MGVLAGVFVLLGVGLVEAASTGGYTAPDPLPKCTRLSTPENPRMVLWHSAALSTRRVDAYEFAASWDSVPGAASYTVCYTQNTQSRTGGLTHTYKRCVTQNTTVINEAYTFYANNGLLTARVRANGKASCEASQWTNLKAATNVTGANMICTDAKVNSENGPMAFPFITAGDAPATQAYISKIEREVASKGGDKYRVTVNWQLGRGFVNATNGKAVKLEVCVGPTRYFSREDAAALTSYTCQYVTSGHNGRGSAVTNLKIMDRRAVYISGTLRAVGYCTADSVDTDKVTIATYYKIKVVNPIASGANGVSTVGSSPYHITTTSRTTPDQTIDVNYFTSVMAGMMDTWELPVRTSPEGLIVHDTFMTQFDGVVTIVSSNSGKDKSVAASLFEGDAYTATGLIFTTLLEERAPGPEMYFKYASSGTTTIESKFATGGCVAENDSDDEYQPAFTLAKCAAKDKKQQFAFEEFAPGWSQPGTTWVYTRDMSFMDVSKWALA